MTWLSLYVLALSLYDLRTRRIPNWATFPLILAGLIAHFPGYPDIWFASIGLFLSWANGWMGAGELVWRWIRKQPIANLLTPGAWRTIPFLLLCWYVH